jgi:hypothetical protein
VRLDQQCLCPAPREPQAGICLAWTSPMGSLIAVLKMTRTVAREAGVVRRAQPSRSPRDGSGFLPGLSNASCSRAPATAEIQNGRTHASAGLLRASDVVIVVWSAIASQLRSLATPIYPCEPGHEEFTSTISTYAAFWFTTRSFFAYTLRGASPCAREGRRRPVSKHIIHVLSS